MDLFEHLADSGTVGLELTVGAGALIAIVVAVVIWLSRKTPPTA